MEPVVEEGHEEGHAEAHHEESFIRRWVFSQDHKVIGCQYAVTALLFLFFGFCLMLLMRFQLAYPGEPLPIIGGLLGDEMVAQGIMLPDFYNSLGAMHGTIMVFHGRRRSRPIDAHSLSPTEGGRTCGDGRGAGCHCSPRARVNGR